MTAETPRLIAHLDMDAFYASVELLRRPELRGLPVVVGGGRRQRGAEVAGPAWPRLRDYVGRGVVTTATYEARALGVGSGMGLMKAARLAPGAIRLAADFEAYRRYSRLFKDAVRSIAPTIEDRGIDEIYIDLTEVVPVGHRIAVDPATDGASRARLLASAIKDAVRAATGLSASIGVAPNKLLAKIASDLDKPDGLTILTPDDLPARIWPLPVRRINGVGPKAEARLAALGFETIGDLARCGHHGLVERLGAQTGNWLHTAALGIDSRPIVTERDPKSVSREVTFDRDLDRSVDRAELGAVFTELCTKVSADLQRLGVAGRTVGVKLRFADFTTVTRDRTEPLAVVSGAEIRRLAGSCLKRIDLDRRIRLLGVRVSSLHAEGLPDPAPAVAASGLLFD
jgi:DNA polymerase-4